ncbi:hypothetical protein [Streptomyces gardneri]|uniref:hypothetical protein n=1 Tax=Streptomyces gardneri TaxID=66892 RepID=UPI003530BF93
MARAPRAGAGRPRRRPDAIAPDKAYSSGAIRQTLRRRGTRGEGRHLPVTVPMAGFPDVTT